MQISIIIPVYQVEDYLKECLDSIVRQDHKIGVQAIIVDDGSKDQSSLIAQEYVDRYPNRFEYYRKVNGGLSDARNFGVPYAKGEYLMFLDGDDYLADHACKTIIDTFEKTNADLLFFDYINFDEEHQEVYHVYEGTSSFVSEQQYLLCPPTAWNKVMKTKLYREQKISFPKGIWYEDLATTGAYVNFARKLYYLQDGLYYYRQRSQSIMNQESYNPKMMDMLPAIQNLFHQMDCKAYYEELEYLCVCNLFYNSGERLLKYHRTKELTKLVQFVNEQFPHCLDNNYLKKRSRFYRLICSFVSKEHYRSANLLYKLKNKMV